MKVIEGDFSANTAKYAIVAGRFNSTIVDGLVSGAIDTLRRHGVPVASPTGSPSVSTRTDCHPT